MPINTLNTATEFNSKHKVDAYTSTGDIEEGLWTAYDEIIDLTGQDAVTDAASATPTDVRRARRMKRAERHLAYGYVAVNVGSRMREGGVVERESKIMDDAVVNYLDPDAVEKFNQQHREIAMRELDAYLTRQTVAENALVSTVKYF